MSEHDLFQAEEAAIEAASSVHALAQLDAAAYRSALGELVGKYRRLVRESRRLILHSDRQEKELTALNGKLQQLAAQLDYKATHDSLTGALTRGAVIDRVSTQLQHTALSLVLLDIDHFKKINDGFGHPVGDAVIVELIARVRTVVGGQGEIGRVGGEEFTLVLPGFELDAAAALANTVRIEICSRPFHAPSGTQVSASFGVSWSPRGATFDQAYGRADQALYEAKRSGRNRVECARQ
jgi:diguanylate cyclase (GGDEF)-like protein